jgi:hypothetical protein
MEPVEVPEYAEHMNEAHEAHEKNMMRVSLIISILAALVAAVTVLGHREHTEAVLLQSRTGEQWQQFQSHKVRIQQAQIFTDLMSVQGPAESPELKKKLDSYQAQIAKWQTQADDEEEKAREIAADVDKSEGRAARFDIGEAFLQIAVVLASITLLTRHRRYVITGCVIGLVGTLAVASAYLIR